MYAYMYVYIYIYILRTCIHACFIHAHRYLFIMYTHSCECFKMTYVHIDFIFTVTHLYNNSFAAKMKKSNARHAWSGRAGELLVDRLHSRVAIMLL